MATVYFRTTDVRPLIEQARSALAHLPSPEADLADREVWDFQDAKPAEAIGEAPLPSLLLVSDLSVYLTSNAVIDVQTADGLRPVAFAEGLHPRENPRWYEQVTALIGFDHMCQSLPVDAIERLCMDAPEGWLGIAIGEEKLRVSAHNRLPTGVPA